MSFYLFRGCASVSMPNINNSDFIYLIYKIIWQLSFLPAKSWVESAGVSPKKNKKPLHIY